MFCLSQSRRVESTQEAVKELRPHQHAAAQTCKGKHRGACSTAICHFPSAGKFQLQLFTTQLNHMIVLETSSYWELLEHRKIHTPEFTVRQAW